VYFSKSDVVECLGINMAWVDVLLRESNHSLKDFQVLNPGDGAISS